MLPFASPHLCAIYLLTVFLVQYLEEFPDEAEGDGDGSWVQGLFGVEFSVSGRVKHGEGEEGLNESVQVRTQTQ